MVSILAALSFLAGIIVLIATGWSWIWFFLFLGLLFMALAHTDGGFGGWFGRRGPL